MSGSKTVLDTNIILYLLAGDKTVAEEIKSIYINLRKKYRIKLGDAATAATAIFLDFPFMSADKGFNKIEELQLTFYKHNS